MAIRDCVRICRMLGAATLSHRSALRLSTSSSSSAISQPALGDAFARPKLQSCLENIKKLKLGTAQPARPDTEIPRSSILIPLGTAQPARPDTEIPRSSILIPLCTSGGGKPSVLFTLRSSRLLRHKGYVCFPGGMEHAEDIDPVDTALRETEEELGVSRSKVEVLGTFPTFYNPRDKLSMTVVLAMLGESGRDIDLDVDLNVNDAEVQLAFVRTLEELCEKSNLRYTQFRGRRGTLNGGDYAMPVFLAGQFKVWGLTAMVLNAFLKTLLPDAYHHEVKCSVLKKSLYIKD
uniref:Putative nucleoside diphosphate-linked moiety x motif 8 mitochondrial ovary overexpressed n=1 Tax=Rhipicephalus microplus TaxID=6941 RepID=A0A6M2CYT2_RHIMP